MAIPVESVSAGSGGGEDSSANESVGSFSFDSVHEQALSKFEGNDTPPSGEQVGTPDASVADAPVGDAPNVDNASAAQMAKLSDDELVSVTVDGQEVTMPWGEAKGGVMRQAKFTKEMQSLRQQQQQFETERTTLAQAHEERNVLIGLLKNEDLMKQFLAKQYPHLVQQAQEIAQQQQVDPNDIATVGQVEQVARAYAENVNSLVNQLKNELNQQVATVTQTIEDRAATAKLSESINGTIADIFKEHSYLQEVIPNADQVLRYEVLKLQPSTPEETLAAFKQVANGWVEQFNKAVNAQTKTQVINKQKLVANNIQPPGGAPIQPQPTSYRTKDGKVDWDKLRESALNMMNSK